MKYMLFITASAVIVSLIRCSSFPSCISVTPPKIQFTGNKTAVERQIVGEYRELEKDAWMISSVRTSGGKAAVSAAPPSDDPVLYKALKVLEYHRMKIRSYKNESAVGESATGYVSYIRQPRYENDPMSREIVLRVIANENEARKTVFARSLASSLKRDPDENEIAAFGRQYAAEMQAAAQKNDMIEDQAGRWMKK